MGIKQIVFSFAYCNSTASYIQDNAVGLYLFENYAQFKAIAFVGLWDYFKYLTQFILQRILQFLDFECTWRCYN